MSLLQQNDANIIRDFGFWNKNEFRTKMLSTGNKKKNNIWKKF